MDPDKLNAILPILAKAGIILPPECAEWDLNRFLGCLHTAALTAEKNGGGAIHANSLNSFGLSLDGPLDNPADEPAPAPDSTAAAEGGYRQFEELVNRGRNPEPVWREHMPRDTWYA